MRADIYDFEGVFEGASKTLLTAEDLDVFTTRDPAQFQKERARVELAFTLGPGAMQRPYVEQGDDQNPTDEREVAWRGKLQFELVTPADPVLHASYMVRLRWLLSTLRSRLNAVLPFHSVGLVRDGSEQRTLNPQDGYHKTVLVRDIDFSVRPDAWPALNTTTGE